MSYTYALNSAYFYMKDMISYQNQTDFNNPVQNPLMADMMALLTDFPEHLCKHNGELSTSWMSYVDIVENVLLDLLRASHEGESGDMISWCFANDKTNYARYFSPCFAQVKNLTNSSVHEAFMKGQFSVQQPLCC